MSTSNLISLIAQSTPVQHLQGFMSTPNNKRRPLTIFRNWMTGLH